MEKSLKYLLYVLFLLVGTKGAAQTDTAPVDISEIRMNSELLSNHPFWRDTLSNDSLFLSLLPGSHRLIWSEVPTTEELHQGKLRQRERNNWRIILITGILLALALSRFLFPGQIFIYTSAFARKKTLEELFEEQKSEIGSFSIWMVLVSCFLYAFSLQYLAWNFGIRISDYAWGDYIFAFLGLFTFFIVKYFLQIGMARILESAELASSLIFTSSYVHFITSFLSLPLFMYFLLHSWPLTDRQTGVLLVIVLTGLIVVRTVRALIQSSSSFRAPLFYLILYLCALELAPWLVLFKLLEINLN